MLSLELRAERLLLASACSRSAPLPLRSCLQPTRGRPERGPRGPRSRRCCEHWWEGTQTGQTSSRAVLQEACAGDPCAGDWVWGWRGIQEDIRSLRISARIEEDSAHPGECWQRHRDQGNRRTRAPRRNTPLSSVGRPSLKPVTTEPKLR